MRFVLHLLKRGDDKQVAAASADDLDRAGTIELAVRTANDELEERGLAARVTHAPATAGLPMTTQRLLGRVVSDAVVPLIRSSREPGSASAVIDCDDDFAWVELTSRDRLLTTPSALDARIRLQSGTTQRQPIRDGGSRLVIRVPREAPTAARRRRLPRPLSLAKWVLLALLVVITLDRPGPWVWVDLAAGSLVLLNIPLGVAVGLAWTLFAALGLPELAYPLPLITIPFTAAWLMPRRQMLLAGAGVLATSLVTSVSHPQPYELLVSDLSDRGLAALFGLGFRLNRVRTERVRARRRALEQEREALVADVRSDLARDLHDVVAHQLSVATLQIMGHRHHRRRRARPRARPRGRRHHRGRARTGLLGTPGGRRGGVPGGPGAQPHGATDR